MLIATNFFNTLIICGRCERTPHVVIDLLRRNTYVNRWCLHLHSLAFGVFSIHRWIQFSAFHHNTTQLVYLHESTTSFRSQPGEPSVSWRAYIITSLPTLIYLKATSSIAFATVVIYYNHHQHISCAHLLEQLRSSRRQTSEGIDNVYIIVSPISSTVSSFHVMGHTPRNYICEKCTNVVSPASHLILQRIY